MPAGDLVELVLPLGHRHTATARLVAAALGADAGLNVDELDDLRLAVDEVVAVVVDAAGPDATRVVVHFVAEPGTVTVRAAADAPAALARTDIDPLALRIIDAVADGFDVADGALVVIKRSAAGDGT